MVLVKIPRIWDIPESKVTPESVWVRRRTLLKGMAVAGIGSFLPSHLFAAQKKPSPLNARRNPKFQNAGRKLTPEKLAARFNNFYEFGGTKDIWKAAQRLPVDPWRVKIDGLCHHPVELDRDDLIKKFPLEERVYRFRCVEAWAMVVPWIGFPMKAIIDLVQPLGKARYVRFVSYYNPDIMPGPRGMRGMHLPWPYQEGLRIDEMANELAFFAVGIYGHMLPPQHGAPIREVVPWKYGFKGAKSIVHIEFMERQPATFWNTLSPHEYDFYANVDPDVPHPRWSQRYERVMGYGNIRQWRLAPTRKYNGYGEYVAHLYE